MNRIIKIYNQIMIDLIGIESIIFVMFDIADKCLCMIRLADLTKMCLLSFCQDLLGI